MNECRTCDYFSPQAIQSTPADKSGVGFCCRHPPQIREHDSWQVSYGWGCLYIKSSFDLGIKDRRAQALVFILDIQGNMYYLISKYQQGGQCMKIEKTTVVNLKRFPQDLHRQAKSQAALEGLTLQDLIIRAVTEHLNKKGNGRKRGGL